MASLLNLPRQVAARPNTSLEHQIERNRWVQWVASRRISDFIFLNEFPKFFPVEVINLSQKMSILLSTPSHKFGNPIPSLGSPHTPAQPHHPISQP